MIYRAGWDWFFAGMRYDARWRKFRKEFHQHVDLAAENYKEYQQYEALRFVLKLVESPKKFMEHIRLLVLFIYLGRLHAHKS